MDDSTWEIICPNYSMADLSNTEQWWYFEGHFWGGYEERLKYAAEDCERLMRIQELLETNRALESNLRKIREEFSWSDFHA